MPGGTLKKRGGRDADAGEEDDMLGFETAGNNEPVGYSTKSSKPKTSFLKSKGGRAMIFGFVGLAIFGAVMWWQRSSKPTGPDTYVAPYVSPEHSCMLPFDDEPDELMIGVVFDVNDIRQREAAVNIHDTWGTRFRDIRFFSPEPDARSFDEMIKFYGPRWQDHFLLSPLKKSADEPENFDPEAWMLLPALQKMYQINANKRFYLLVNHETFILPHSYLCHIRQTFQRADTEWVYHGAPREARKLNVITSGTGITMSNPMLKALQAHIPGCIKSFVASEDPGDVRVGLCVQQAAEAADADYAELLGPVEKVTPGFVQTSLRHMLQRKWTPPPTRAVGSPWAVPTDGGPQSIEDWKLLTQLHSLHQLFYATYPNVARDIAAFWEDVLGQMRHGNAPPTYAIFRKLSDLPPHMITVPDDAILPWAVYDELDTSKTPIKQCLELQSQKILVKCERLPGY